MRVSVKKWGNSASVRIPASIMRAAHIELNQPVDIREDEGRIVIEPVAPPDDDLETLVAGITPENLPELVDFGAPVGNEVW